MYPHFESVAALAGEPARAAMLTVLFDGRAMPAGQLARSAGVSAATASVHLRKMVAAGLLRVRAQGRHRYYELANKDVAQALESLGAIAQPQPIRSLRDSLSHARLRYARSCYNHLAGELAIALVEALLRRGAIEPEDDGFRLSEQGCSVLLELGVDVRSLFKRQTTHIKACIDWTERRPHISGPLGAALLQSLLEHEILERGNEPRVLGLTQHGRTLLEGFGFNLTADETLAV